MSEEVRRATLDDYRVVNRILEQDSIFHASLEPDWMTDTSGIAEHDYCEYLAHTDTELLVCVRDGSVVGLIQLRIGSGGDPGMRYQPYGWVDEVAVEESMRSTGIGKALMMAAEKWAKESGLKMLMLDVWLRNRRAISLYEAMGYEPFRQRMFHPIDDA